MRALLSQSPGEWAEMIAELGAAVFVIAMVLGWAMVARAVMTG